MTIKERILQASYYAHMKGAEEMARLGERKIADALIKAGNEISIKLEEAKKSSNN